MGNSNIQKARRAGSMAALALLMAVPAWTTVDAAPSTAYTANQSVAAGGQINKSVLLSALVPGKEQNGDGANSGSDGLSSDSTNGLVDGQLDAPGNEPVDGQSDPSMNESAGEQPEPEQTAETDEAALQSLLLAAPIAIAHKPLFNQGFEQPLNDDGSIAGWSMFFAANDATSHEVTQDVRYYGNSSLKLVDTSNSLPIYIHSDQLPVTPGYTYNGSAMVYIAPNAGNAGGASLVLRFYDASGKQVNTDKDGENIVHLRTIGAWTRVNVTGVAPGNAVYARMGASISNYFTAQSGAFYDDFTLSSPQEEEKSPGVLHLQMPAGNLGSQPLEAKVSLSRGVNVQKATGSLTYDPTMMEIANVSIAQDINADEAAVLEWSAEAGVFAFELSRPAGSPISGDKGLLNITFTLLGEGDKAELTLLQGAGVQDADDVLNHTLYTSAADELASTQIRRASLDVNDDGKIDLYDVIAVAKLTGQMTTNDNWKYDTNNDGIIDRADVETLSNAILNKPLD